MMIPMAQQQAVYNQPKDPTDSEFRQMNEISDSLRKIFNEICKDVITEGFLFSRPAWVEEMQALAPVNFVGIKVAYKGNTNIFEAPVPTNCMRVPAGIADDLSMVIWRWCQNLGAQLPASPEAKTATGPDGKPIVIPPPVCPDCHLTLSKGPKGWYCGCSPAPEEETAPIPETTTVEPAPAPEVPPVLAEQTGAEDPAKPKRGRPFKTK